ncbi:MAG: putative middle wall protein precursor [Symbiobacteriaceae bacterium]|jgi:hypothetical protein|nr:putative middle wall protein precursor [Symbiobacteriaceae bacterium]
MGLMKKLTSALVASSLVLSLVGSAFAAYTPAAGEMAGTRMQKLGMLQGRDGDLALNSEITRAELVTVIVRAFGKEDDAKLLKGSTIFPDIANHWASGNIAMAVALVEKAGSDPIGMPDGTFAPDAKLTPAQAVAFLMKFVGVKADANKAWPANYLDVAVDKGLITAEDKAILAPMVNDNATRGLVFYVFDRAFYNYDLGAGETFYTKYVDQTAPELNVTKPAATTMDSKVTITGKATGATEVKVGSTMVTLAADGSFSYDLNLPELKDYDVTVVASDLAGNMDTESFTVTRTVGNAATIEATLEAQLVKAGAEVALNVVVKDKNGNAIEDADYDVEITGEIGTYADGVFTAAAMPATGTITVSMGEATPAVLDVAVVAGDVAKIEVTGAQSAKVGQAVTFSAKGFDAAGNEVALDNVSWTASKGGVINPTTGEFAGTASGTVTVSAKVGELTGTANVAVYGDATGLKVVAPEGLIANNKSIGTLTVYVVDAAGSVVSTSDATVNVTFGVGSNISFVDADGTNPTVNDSVKAVNGKATFTVKSNAFAAASQTVSATSGTLTGALQTVTAAAPTISAVKLSMTPNTAVTEATGSVTLTASLVDAADAVLPAPTGGVTIALSNTNTTSAILPAGAQLVFTAGASTPNSTINLTLAGVPGDVTISGTTTAGYTVTPVSFSTKLAGSATKLVLVKAPVDMAANGTFKVQYALQDALGTTKTTYTTAGGQATVTAKMKNVATGTETPGVVAIAAGIAEATFANVTAAGTYEFSATGSDVTFGTLATPEVSTAKVNPGAADRIGNLKINGVASTNAADPYTLVANGAQTATLTVEVQDQWGNKVPTATNAVTFKRTAGTSFTTLPSTMTVTPVDGVATLTITSGISDSGAAEDEFTVEAVKDAAAGSKLNVHASAANVLVATQIVGLPANIVVAADADAVAAGNQAFANSVAGTSKDISFKVVDASGRFVSTDNGRAVTMTVKKGTTVVNTLTATTVNGIAKFSVTLNEAAATYTFKAAANIAGVDKEAAYDASTVVAAAAAKAAIKAPQTNVESATQVAVTVDITDEFGNPVTLPAGQWVEVSYLANGIAYSDATNNKWLTGFAAGNDDVTFTARGIAETIAISDADGKVTIKDAANAVVKADIPVTAAQISTYVAGPAYKLGLFEVPAAVTAGGTTTLKVGVYDGLGNLKTNLAAIPANFAVATTGTNPGTPTINNAGATLSYGVISVPVSGLSVAGNYTFKAYQTATPTVVEFTGIALTVNAGTATHVVATPAAMNADGSSVQILNFKVADGATGNTVSSYTGTMKFEVVSNSAGATLLGTSAPIVNGVAQIQVKAGTIAGSIVIKPSVEGVTTGLTIANVTVDFKSNAPSSTASTNSQAAGTVYFILRDANGNAITPANTSVTNLRVYLAGAATADAVADSATALTHVGNGVWQGSVGANTHVKVYSVTFAADGVTVNGGTLLFAQAIVAP